MCNCKKSKCKKCCKPAFIKKNLGNFQNVIDRAVAIPASPPGAAPEFPGFFGFLHSESKDFMYTAGVRDYTTQEPFTQDTIVRIASISKFISSFGLLQLLDRGFANITDPVKKYIPEFGNIKVLEKFIPSISVDLNNVITATNGSNVLNINESGHGKSNGDIIGIENSTDIQGILASEINQVHVITVIDANNYTITVTTNATGNSGAGEGGSITIKNLETGVKRTIFANIVYYYKLNDLIRDITINHLLAYTVGWLYFGEYSFFGWDKDLVLAATQAGILSEVGITSIPNPSNPLSSGTIQDWTIALTSVPLLFQPGDSFCYGPVAATHGALVEKLDPLGRTIDQYLRQEVWDPLGMNDTGFFIYNSDPNYTDKVNRVMTEYISDTFIPISAIPGLQFLQDFFYGTTYTKTLCLGDSAIFSTPSDLAKFYKMIINDGKTPSGQRLISPAMILSLSEDHSNDSILTLKKSLNPLTDTSLIYPTYGLGVAVTTGATDILNYGNSKRSIGWVGALGIRSTIDIHNKKIVVTGGDKFADFGDSSREKAHTVGFSCFPCLESNDKDVTNYK